MPEPITLKTVEQLAPSATTFDRVQRLSQLIWQSLHYSDDGLLWGIIRGNSSTPYQVVINPTVPEYPSKCTCRSREKPCKHALALLYIQATHPEKFTPSPPPDWVTTWTQTQDKPKRTVRRTSPKTLKKRQDEIMRGLDELDVWLNDIVRVGMATLPNQGRDFFDIARRRLNDAKAPTVAERVGALRGILRGPSTRDGAWVHDMLREFGELHLIIQSFRRFDTLTPEQQFDLRTAVGWTVLAGERLDMPKITDTWHVMGVRVRTQDKFRIKHTWLHGEQSGQLRLLIETVYGKVKYKHLFSAGQVFHATVDDYPSTTPQRVHVDAYTWEAAPFQTSPAVPLADVTSAHHAALTRNPWLGQVGAAVQVTLVQAQRKWYIIDAHDHALPLDINPATAWHINALTGGHAMWMFGEWNGQHFTPLTLTTGDGHTHAID